MPRIARTIGPRIRKSIQERGLWRSICRSLLLPAHLVHEYHESRRLNRIPCSDGFDRDHGVETDGDFAGWTYLSDLNIPSANWIGGANYLAIEPPRFHAAVSTLSIPFEEFVFVDFGSGKGRALLLASGFRSRRSIGVEFSPELHAVAQNNIRKYQSENVGASSSTESRMESICAD